MNNKLKYKSFADKMKQRFFGETLDIIAEEQLCDFVNNNNIKVISIGSGWNRFQREFILFYKEEVQGE